MLAAAGLLSAGCGLRKAGVSAAESGGGSTSTSTTSTTGTGTGTSTSTTSTTGTGTATTTTGTSTGTVFTDHCGKRRTSGAGTGRSGASTSGMGTTTGVTTGTTTTGAGGGAGSTVGECNWYLYCGEGEVCVLPPPDEPCMCPDCWTYDACKDAVHAALPNECASTLVDIVYSPGVWTEGKCCYPWEVGTICGGTGG